MSAGEGAGSAKEAGPGEGVGAERRKEEREGKGEVSQQYKTMFVTILESKRLQTPEKKTNLNVSSFFFVTMYLSYFPW